MAHGAEYYQGLAARYEALAVSMPANTDRTTVASIATQYRQLAAEARRLNNWVVLLPPAPAALAPARDKVSPSYPDAEPPRGVE
jgi:hypothetical protein